MHSEKILRKYPNIYACAGQLNQVLINVLMNSVQAMGAPGEIEIRTSADSEYVHIDIIDDGPGFPEKDIFNLFDPSSQPRA
ncbi:MAG: ATP-binding protein [Gammaproteobacteria bacterium]|nr:ATP-binding protein [Gammaproteobacteria bacterium]MDG2336728.1 ATP-binding protein [Gammaproteobacteria bacterium]